jgi:hypothetical protein
MILTIFLLLPFAAFLFTLASFLLAFTPLLIHTSRPLLILLLVACQTILKLCRPILRPALFVGGRRANACCLHSENKHKEKRDEFHRGLLIAESLVRHLTVVNY